RSVGELSKVEIDAIYAAPCQAAQQTAHALAADHDVRVKVIEKLQNLNQGLWHGKLIEELKKNQPRVYKQWQEHPQSVCPPQGEPFAHAQTRVRGALAKLLRKHRSGIIALVAPEPVASLIRSALTHGELGDLWKAECECGDWELIDVGPAPAASY
ncbi:MAG: histidine phosphatase family protein, partial [Planctomycetes bacterium]|nr:histidine phosphatase family protein [Planctomycetota bacterium]